VPFAQAALLAGIHLLAIGVGLANGLHLIGEEIRIGLTLAWVALGVMTAAALGELWRPGFERFMRVQLYTCRLFARCPVLHGVELSIADWYWTATLLLAAYVLLIVALFRVVQAMPMLRDIFHLPAQPEDSGRWFWHVQLGTMALVVVLSMWIALT